MPDSMDDLKILVIDDEESIRVGSERILARMGCQIRTAARGDAGLALMEGQKFGIVLLDMKMPGMDGMEVLRRIREMDATILVIVITGYATVEIAIEAMKSGAYDFIPKPFEPDQLRIVVNRALEKIRLTREAERLDQERKQTLSDLDMEKSRIATILNVLPEGVVVTNAAGQVVLMNPAFCRLLDLDPEQAPGDRIQAYIPDQGVCDLILEISRGKHLDYEDIPPYEFAVSPERFLLARGRPVLGDRHECLGAVVNLVDITTMKVLDRLKSEFVAKVSHELRSPLSTIHEQLAHVLSDMAGNVSSDDQHILTRAKEKTKGLISLIGDLLDLSRIEAGTVCQEPKPVRLEDLLKSIIDFLESRAAGKHQVLSLELPSEPLPPLTADPLGLESIFGNLITNAITYTQEGGEIRVKAEMAGLHVRITVQDNGFGIEAKHLEKIFERFYRVKNEKTRYITGTGLGLPIVKGLVESLNGFITVESTPGIGSTFTVSLPVKC
jgi:two-component system phosphate regulon sensor histidine kinase PhoR